MQQEIVEVAVVQSFWSLSST